MARRRKKKTRKWIQKAIKKPGALRATAKRAGALKDGISVSWLKKQAEKGSTKTAKRARLALTLRKLRKKRRKKK